MEIGNRCPAVQFPISKFPIFKNTKNAPQLLGPDYEARSSTLQQYPSRLRRQTASSLGLPRSLWLTLPLGRNLSEEFPFLELEIQKIEKSFSEKLVA